jgi:circadian clock protein KaiB
MRKNQDPEIDLNKAPTEIKVEFLLRLFITGATPNSTKAVTNLKKICEEHLEGRYALEIVDVYQQAEVAWQEQLVALPMLVKKHPLPERRIIGDLSDTNRVLKGLGLIY